MNLAAENQISYCFIEQKPCIGWAQTYLKDCLCNLNDYISFGLGLVSLFCWAVAEIPQIVTNFGTKSSHGVSILFLLTWVVGDIFNLIGCILEPATLPTQLYTAALYSITTIVLVLQSFYYDYIYKCIRKTKRQHPQEEVEEVIKRPLIVSKTEELGVPIPNGRDNVKGSRRPEYYYMSARSLAGSMTPPTRSNLWPVRSGPSAVTIDGSSSSSDDEEGTNTPSANSASQPKAIPRSAGSGTFLATALNMPNQSNALVQVSIGLTGRKLLQDSGSSETYIVGQCLGWAMAAIYMGGRIPQIWLNIKRGSVEGLNPLMFIFALIANVTYVGSILVRTTEWDKIRANLPWLLDAAGCVVMDSFIISQYIYYRYYLTNRRQAASKGGDRDYVEASKE